jgi:Amt family ammonium transporter
MSFVVDDHLGRHGRRPLRVSPAWVGAPRPAAGPLPLDHHHLLPVREAVWIWSVRRYARVALWALPLSALLYGWNTLGVSSPAAALGVRLAAGWLSVIAMVALTGLLAGCRTRRTAAAGMLIGLAGTLLLLPFATMPIDTVAQSTALTAEQMRLAAWGAAAVTGAGWLLLGLAVLRSRLVNPADGILLMLAAVSIGAGTFAAPPLPTVGALLLLAAGMGIAWTGSRLIPPA